MARNFVGHLYRGKLLILLLFLAITNLGVNDSGWMIATEAGCEACENLQEEISFSPAYLELLEGESKTTTASFTGGAANWTMPPSSVTSWCSTSFSSSSTGVNKTTIRAGAGSRIPLDFDFPGRRVWLQTPVTAEPVDKLVATTHRYLTVYGLGSYLYAPASVPIVEGETRTIRVSIANSPPSSGWTFGATLSPKAAKMLVLEGIAPTGPQSAAITLRAVALTGCSKAGFCSTYGLLDVWADRQSDLRRVETEVFAHIYYRD